MLEFIAQNEYIVLVFINGLSLYDRTQNQKSFTNKGLRVNFKFSGHETFAFRYAWLPKAFLAVRSNPRIFSDENHAMVELGVGKNMVKSIKYWATLLGIIEPCPDGGFKETDFAKALLDQNIGLDPYLEDSQTLWLLHWRLTTASEPIFVWHYLFNRWQDSEIINSIIHPAIFRELEGIHNISIKSLDSLISVFFHTYVPTRGKKSKIVEDNLDCPLVQLKLIEYSGERDGSSGKKESIYAFRRGSKPEISQELFLYCLTDYWEKVAYNEKTLSFGQIANDAGSPGQIFKLSDDGIQERLNKLMRSNKHFSFTDSSTSRSLERKFSDFSKASSKMLSEVFN